MKLFPILALSSLAATPLLAEQTRQQDAHEHGVGQLNIAFDGDQVAMEFHAPGSDIVGFEYVAESQADLAAIDAAITTLSSPLALFAISPAAGCTVVSALAELVAEADHEDVHDHDEHKENDDHDEHDHEEEGHKDDHDDHDAHDGEEDAGHTEFHAEYLLKCADPAAIQEITFAYFGTFPNAKEVEVQIISDAGATSFEVERDAPVMDLRGKL